MNYRSVTVLGRTRPVDDPREKEAALRAFVEHVIPGRSDEIRGGDRGELAATVVLAVPSRRSRPRSGPGRQGRGGGQRAAGVGGSASARACSPDRRRLRMSPTGRGRFDLTCNERSAGFVPNIRRWLVSWGREPGGCRPERPPLVPKEGPCAADHAWRASRCSPC